MKLILIGLIALSASHAFAQSPSAPAAPFEGMNTTWINGQNRQTEFPLAITSSSNLQIATVMAYVDGYYAYSLNNPTDHTIVSSATVGRHQEFAVGLATLGVDVAYRNAIGRLSLQVGSMLALIQDADASVMRGRNASLSNLKYIREAAAGYHLNLLYGLNIELGIFSSYLGMDSYLTQENWYYQRSIINDFAPSYLTGTRIQLFPSPTFKTELWIVNGWQSYSQAGNTPGIGNANLWRPSENLQLMLNLYWNSSEQPGLQRFHSNSSVAYRYFHRGSSGAISQSAAMLDAHAGYQAGAGATAARNHLYGFTVANRTWLCQNRVAITLRYDYLSNAGLYLAASPSGITPNAFTDALAIMSSPVIKASQLSLTADYMPSDFVTLRLEYGFRSCNLPYFAGHGGTTSPDGWQDTSTAGWRPSLADTEQRITAAATIRL